MSEIFSLFVYTETDKCSGETWEWCNDNDMKKGSEKISTINSKKIKMVQERKNYMVYYMAQQWLAFIQSNHYEDWVVIKLKLWYNYIWGHRGIRSMLCVCASVCPCGGDRWDWTMLES